MSEKLEETMEGQSWDERYPGISTIVWSGSRWQDMRSSMFQLSGHSGLDQRKASSDWKNSDTTTAYSFLLDLDRLK